MVREGPLLTAYICVSGDLSKRSFTPTVMRDVFVKLYLKPSPTVRMSSIFIVPILS